jgi:iron complex outermembrane receptor protein
MMSHCPRARRILFAALAVSAMTPLSVSLAQAQETTTVSGVTVDKRVDKDGYATAAQFDHPVATFGPLGAQAILDAPQSLTPIPEDLIVNQQTRTVNDTLRFLPSVEIRDQQGLEVSRPQSRGFQSSIAENTRLDGLNVIGTTAIATENLSAIEVLNGPGGALYGPEAPSGVFDYILKRPTDEPLFRFVEGFQSNGLFTEQADVGGRVGPLGVRLNVVHGEGESYVDGSHVDRTLASIAIDYHLDDKTVFEADYSHYDDVATGLPGSIVYDSGSTSKTILNTILPKAVDPTREGYGQPGAGFNLSTETALGKIKHTFNDQWSVEVGGLYENAIRTLTGITNTLTDNTGDYTVTKNFTAVPQFTIGSNEAYLNGHVPLFGMMNDISIGTNGFINGQDQHRNTIAVVLTTPTTLQNLSDPMVLPTKATPNNGGLYHSADVFEQSIIFGDTIHFNSQWALQGVVNTSFLHDTTYGTTGAITSQDKRDGVVSPTVSLIYKPFAPLALHATWAQSLEEGDQATTSTTTANSGQFLAPYNDTIYEVGAKYAVTSKMLITLNAFRMTRPYANTVLEQGSATEGVFEAIGEQRNNGVELFAQGEATPDLSIFGGVTYIDARLEGTGVASTNNKLIVGVPPVKSDIVFDYHPAWAHGLAGTFSFNYEGKRAATDTNNSSAPSFVTLDPGVRYSTPFLGHFITARFEVVNVTDTHYYASIADGTIVGSPGANTAYLGAPRTYNANLEFDY